MKYHLRATIKNKEGIYLQKPLALTQYPDDIDKIWLEKFIANEYTPKKIVQHKKNAEYKAQCKISHALGRKSYKRVYEELEEEHPAEGVTRSEAWKRAYKNKVSRNVLPCALEKYYGALQRKVVCTYRELIDEYGNPIRKNRVESWKEKKNKKKGGIFFFGKEAQFPPEQQMEGKE